ncbi:winged helix-turn-helix transcriptional regulator [Defluviitalea saccharophila]|uniref:Winged helix-turn-helix transcriptional regulator n=1 Tax=Defluviitalea saccharophila TaxID=879970 RepID=A0ABZ2Y6E4_9FIRM|nr:winged helix-turn-helix transcriptional regulator [Candidatus Epulonipiscium sp.]
MEKELEILTHIQENEHITQREIAEKTGLSLGAVNLLLKKMIKTGLIKIERLNARTLKYILTPEGMKEKTAKTYHYIVRTYETITRIQAVSKVILEKQKKKGIKTIYLYGNQDEVYNVLRITMSDVVGNLDMNYELINNIDAINKTKDSVVLIWNEENEEVVKAKQIPYINILYSL